jgi:hypothetical protein
MNIVVLSLAILGLLFWLLSLRRLRNRKWFSAGGHGLTGGILLTIAAVLGAVAVNLHTYRRLTHEEPVAELSFERLAPHRFQATLKFPSGERDIFVLTGDEWQLDARILKWQGLATLLGLDTQFRLERLSGRFRNIERERDGPHTVYPLSPHAGVDLWGLAQRHKRWLPWIDATYGAATFLPMADQATYGVHVTTTGLIGRPLGANARSAIKRWR